MNIAADLIPNLRSLVARVDKLRLDRGELTARIGPVEEAVSRLRRQVNELAAQAAEFGDVRIPVGPDRVAQLIAGQAVSQPDNKEVESRALKQRQINAQRVQATEDLTALQGHLSALHASGAAIDRDTASADADLSRALGDALFDAYKRAATEFVTQHIPYLLSIVYRIRAQTSNGPDWENHAFQGLAVRFYEDYMDPANPASRKLTVLWPRSDGKLASGEPSISEGLITGLIDELRAVADKAEAAGDIASLPIAGGEAANDPVSELR